MVNHVPSNRPWLTMVDHGPPWSAVIGHGPWLTVKFIVTLTIIDLDQPHSLANGNHDTPGLKPFYTME